MEPIIVYATAWCGWCRRLTSALRDVGIAFHEVDIDDDPAAAELVASVNNGNRIVPTVVFADGTTTVNPSVAEVRDLLREQTLR
jgi:mycoredoxin